MKKCVFGVFLQHTRIALVGQKQTIDFIDIYGAQGRIRTTETGIFNEDGSVLLLNYCRLNGEFFGERKSVFLHFEHFRSDTVSPTHKKNTVF